MKIRKVLGYIKNFYEIRVAPCIALNFRFVLYPFYKLMKSYRLIFITNISPNTGHIISELDHLLHRLVLLKKNKRYIWIITPNCISKDCVKIYRHYFYWAVANHFIYELTLPFTMAFPDLTIDCSLSDTKHQINKYHKFYNPKNVHPLLIPKPIPDAIEEWVRYFKNRHRNSNYYPLRTGNLNNTVLKKSLGIKDEKIALIHIKEERNFANYNQTSPESYCESLVYLRNLNYRLIFVGREKMPKLFKEFDMFNYSESAHATFHNDICLFKLASFALISGSGISFLADCYDVPYVYVNSWHIVMSMFSRLHVTVPSLIINPDGRTLTFQEQIDFYFQMAQIPNKSPQNGFAARSPSSSEILEGTKELISLMKNFKSRSFLQDKMCNIDEQIPLFYSQGRFSDYFLERNQHLI